MKKSVLLLPLAFALIVGTGSAIFVFNDDNTKIEIDSNVRVDDVRSNYVFGSSGDSSNVTQKYDIYFFAQSDFNPGRNSANTDPLYNCFHENGAINYGSFSDGSYYKVLNNVDVLYSNDLKEIGIPTTNLQDWASSSSNHYYLQFNGWALTRNVGNYKGFEEGSEYVYGNCNFGNSSINLMTYDYDITKVLSYNTDAQGNKQYDSYKNSDSNTIDLYLYPIYTTGKSYQNSSGNDNNNDPLAMTLERKDGSKQLFFMNEGRIINSQVDNKYPNKDITVYNSQSVDFYDIKALTMQYAYYDENQWRQWNDIYPSSTPGNKNFINQNDPMLSRLTDSSGNGKGMFSLYVFVKTVYGSKPIGQSEPNFDTAITKAEIDYFNSLIDVPYAAVTTAKIKNRFYDILWDAFYQSEMYVVFIRHYEPRIIGGPNGSISYDRIQGQKSTTLKGSKVTNSYYINDVLLTDELESYNYNENCIVDSTVFGIQLDSHQGMDEFKVEIGPEAEAPTINGVSDFNDANYLTKISSMNPADASFITGTDNTTIFNDQRMFVINNSSNESPKIGYGIYTIAVKLKYVLTTINGIQVNTLDTINVFLSRQSDSYMILYDNDNEIPFGTIPGASNLFITPDLETFTNMDFVCLTTYRNSYVDYDAPIFYDVNDVIKTSTSLGQSDALSRYVTLRQIVDYYEKQGKEIYDRISRFVINDESMEMTGFRVIKNHIFQVREMVVQ